MTALVAQRRVPWLAGVLAFSVAALLTREVGTFTFLIPLLGAAAVLLAQRRPYESSADAAMWVVTTIVGTAAFAVVRLAHPGAAYAVTTFGPLASVVAAVAEEIVFRRGLYGLLERYGSAVAIIVCAAVFGLVHAPSYGWTVVPLDVGAGIVLGWQRWASRTWTSPAATHAVANVMGSL